MKKYKHKQLGVIADWSIKNEMYEFWINKSQLHYMDKSLVENSKDWEEIKEEPNYLITAFRARVTDKIVYRINKEGTFNEEHFTEIKLSINDLIDNKAFEIYSVKNSKGEEFTIGDEIIMEDENLTINKFEIYREKYMYVLFKETDEHERINCINKK